VDWSTLVEFEGELKLTVPSPFGPQTCYFDRDKLPEWQSATSIRIFDSNFHKRKKHPNRPLKLYVQLLWAVNGKITRNFYGHRLGADCLDHGPGFHAHHIDDVAISTLDCRKKVLSIEKAADHARITAAHNKKVRDDQARMAATSVG
jgi:hypothetical protein